MNETQEKALMECGRVLARAGLSAIVRPMNSMGESLAVLVVITPGSAKCAAIGFVGEAEPREIFRLDSTESGSDITLSE